MGTAAQNIRVMPATSASSIVTIGANGCPSFYPSDCADQRGSLFLPNESNTYIANSIFEVGIEINLNLATTAPAGFDTVTLGWQGSGGPTVEHSTVFNLFVSNFWLGLFGLNPQPTNFTTFVDPQPSFMQQLVNYNKIPSLSYGYTAGNQYRLDKVYGSLVLGGYDQNRFDHTKNISVGFYPDSSRDLQVQLQSITTDVGSPSNLLPDGAVSVFIDSTVGPMWLPKSTCTAFEEAFGLTYDDDSEYYLVNSTLHDSLTSTNANVTFTIGSESSGGETVDIVLPYGAFDLQLTFPNIMNPNTSYYFPLKRADNDTQYTLGRTFLQEAYLIADYDRKNFTIAPCTWDADEVGTSSIKSILRSNATSTALGEGSGSPTGAIAGGVAGGVVGAIAIIGGIFYFLHRRKRNERRRLAEADDKAAALARLPTQDSGNDGKPFISRPMGGELGGAEVHELNAPYYQRQELDSPHGADPNKHGYSEMEGGGYFAPGKGVPAEMNGSTPIFEMAGSDVHEMPANHRRSLKR